tara:strand:+ start:131 stop:625 length:495 start_codon:yes stop_codon:yes gene_type:complete
MSEQRQLFPPTVVIKDNIKIPDGWIDKLEEWCLKYGKYVEHGRLTTTYGTANQPHAVPWIMNVLDLIAPEEGFDNSWVQIYEPGGFHPIHNHAGTNISGSGCLFLNDGQSTYFQDPLHQSNTATSKVEVGDVLIWDPDIYHFSPPVMEKRIILAFNLKNIEEPK